MIVLLLVGVAGVNLLRNDPGGPPPALPADPPGVSVPPAAPGATQDVIPADTPYMAVPPGTNPPEQPRTGAALAVPDTACVNRQDPGLRALVEQALPVVVGAPEAAVATNCRSGGERRVALEVEGGVLTVVYLPPGWGLANEGGRSAPTASGGTVVVLSQASRNGVAPPFADRLDEVVAYLAPRL